MNKVLYCFRIGRNSFWWKDHEERLVKDMVFSILGPRAKISLTICWMLSWDKLFNLSEF